MAAQQSEKQHEVYFIAVHIARLLVPGFPKVLLFSSVWESDDHKNLLFSRLVCGKDGNIKAAIS